MARSVSTATTATPIAAPTPPTVAPMPSGTAHELPWHCSSMNENPISAPHAPATMMARKASRRAREDGSADSGRSDREAAGDIGVHRRLPPGEDPDRAADLQRGRERGG